MREKIYRYCKNFSKNLKAERVALGMTQKEVAEKLGIKPQSYQAYENNISMPTTENLLKLVDLFDLSLDDVFEIKK